jgi:hypothetical protein
MGKRSRKERRQHQQALVKTGPQPIETIERLRDLLASSPAEGVSKLQKRLGEASVEALAGELGDLAIATCERLRREAKYEEALQLALAARRFSHEMRRQELLAAFAIRRDATVREICEQDPEMERCFRPIVAWLEGGDEPAAAPKASSKTKAFHAVFRLASNIKRGKYDKKSRPSVGSIDEADLEAFGWDELNAASDVLAPGNRRPMDAAYYLSTTDIVKQSNEMQTVLAIALAKKGLLGETVLRRHGIGLSKVATELGRLFKGLEREGQPEAKVTKLLMEMGSEAFDKPDRAAALVYEGYLYMRDDPRKASQCMDRAMGLGGDLHDILRSKVQLIGAKAASLGDSFVKESISASQRLDHILSKEGSSAAPFRVAIAQQQALNYLYLKQKGSALEAVQRANGIMKQAGISEPRAQTNLAMTEVTAISQSSPQKALSILDEIFESVRERSEAWKLRIELERQLGHRDKADELVLQAAELRLSLDLEKEAVQIRRAKGLATVQAGKTSAGELAREFETRFTNAGASDSCVRYFEAQDLGACRAALGVKERVAFDAACLVIASDYEASDLVSLLRILLMDHRADVRAQATLLACCVCLQLVGMKQLIPVMQRPEVSSEVVARVATWYQAKDARGEGKEFLIAVSSRLSRSQLDLVHGARREAGKYQDELAQAVEAVAHLLSPHFDLFENEGSDYLGGVGPILGQARGAEAEGVFAALALNFLERAGVASAKIAQVSARSLEQIGKSLAEARDPLSLTNALESAGLFPWDFPSIMNIGKPQRGKKR